MKGNPITLAQPFGSYVMENVLFKISFPAEFHAQTAVEAAQDAYCDWQEAALGRDVDPTELIARLYAAGAVRVTVTDPTFQAIQDSERAMRDGYVVAPTYMGLYS